MNKETLFRAGLGVIATIGAVELSQWAFTNKLKEEVRKEQKYCCDECGRQGTTQIHHKVAQHLGGSDERVNAVGLCPNDHQKWDELMSEGIIYPGIPISEAKPEQFKSKNKMGVIFERIQLKLAI